MAKIEDLKDFIEKIDDAKKINPLDLSSDQDLSIAIMNLISIEEHLVFSGAKTKDNSFYDLINIVREMRKDFLGRIIKEYKGEVWCISKHLLAASMRVMEVGTKAIGRGNNKEAYELFNKAYELYCLFWGLNTNMIDSKSVKSQGDEIIKTISQSVKEDPESKEMEEEIKENKEETDKKENKSVMGKLKNFVSKAVDCCKE